jgi:hypothetical protein
MKKVILTVIISALTFGVYAQKLKKVDTFDLSTSFEEVKKLYKAQFVVNEALILKDGSTLVVGDTIKLGPSSNKISNDYETIFIGRLTIGGALMGVQPVLASTSFERNTYVLSKAQVWRSMGKTGVKIELKDVNFKSGLGSPYLTASDYSLTRGEIINPNAPMTREEAIDKLKEAKDLFELDMMTKEEYDAIRIEVTPIIRGN